MLWVCTFVSLFICYHWTGLDWSCLVRQVNPRCLGVRVHSVFTVYIRKKYGYPSVRVHLCPSGARYSLTFGDKRPNWSRVRMRWNGIISRCRTLKLKMSSIRLHITMPSTPCRPTDARYNRRDAMCWPSSFYWRFSLLPIMIWHAAVCNCYLTSTDG